MNIIHTPTKIKADSGPGCRTGQFCLTDGLGRLCRGGRPYCGTAYPSTLQAPSYGTPATLDSGGQWLGTFAPVDIGQWTGDSGQYTVEYTL